MKILSMFALLWILALVPPSVRATPLPILGSVVPQALPNPGDVPLLGSVTGTFDFGAGSEHLTGTYEQGVFVDVFGLTCARCLDFYVALTVDPFLATGIFNVALGLFDGFTTNVGYLAEDGDKTPLMAIRPARVIFLFNSPDDPTHIIGPGGSSAALVVATDATAFNRSGDVIINSGSTTNRGTINGLFAPAAVPEPATLLLLALGLAGLSFSRRTR